MKFFFWLGTILIFLLIIAALTAPGEKKFAEYINKDKGGDTMSCKPIIGKSTQAKVLVNIFSIIRVSYCVTTNSLLTGTRLRFGKTAAGADSLTTLKLKVPKITYSENYLGLFGRFWKI